MEVESSEKHYSPVVWWFKVQILTERYALI